MKVFRSTVAALMLLSLAGCIFGGGDDNVEPPAELKDINATLKVTRLWSQKVGKGVDDLRFGLTLSTDGSRIFAASNDGRVAAYDAITGKQVWRTDTGKALAAGPSFGDQLVVVGSSDGEVVAINVEDGAVRWQVQVSSEVLAAPAIGRGLVVVRSVDGKMRALTQDSGEERWLVERQIPRLTLRGNSAPRISGDLVISGFDNGRVAAVTLADGGSAWESALGGQRGRTELERLGDVDADIRIIGDDVYAVGYQTKAAMLAVESGQLLWSRDLSSAHPLGVDWNNVYVTDEQSEVLALERNTGTPVWQQGALRRRDLTGPVAYGTAVVVGDFEGFVHWLNATDGGIIGRLRASKSAIISAPLVIGENLYVLTAGGELVAMRAAAR